MDGAQEAMEDRSNFEPMPQKKIDEFRRELTALSHIHGIGIAGPAQTFIMEREDAGSAYTMNDKSEIEFA